LLRRTESSSREALKQFKTLAAILKVARQTPAQSRLTRYRVDLRRAQTLVAPSSRSATPKTNSFSKS